jgi:hypothetical protein
VGPPLGLPRRKFEDSSWIKRVEQTKNLNLNYYCYFIAFLTKRHRRYTEMIVIL